MVTREGDVEPDKASEGEHGTDQQGDPAECQHGREGELGPDPAPSPSRPGASWWGRGRRSPR